jgi:hypothetical protein
MSDEKVQGPDRHDADVDRSHGKDERRYVPSEVDPNRWVKRLVMLLVLVVGAYLLALVAGAFFPRWWAQQVGDQVNQSVTRGVLWGLFYGFVFTVVPLLLLTQLRRRFFNWTWRGILLVVAVLLAAPNWFTLSIVVGAGNAAHAGERILDVEAPGFRVASAIGAFGAVALVLILGVTGALAHRRKRQVKNLKGQLHERQDGPGPAS